MSDAFGRIRSGCQPLRHSSPIVGFWVQRIGDIVKSPETQMLQPMHSRMSFEAPFLDFRWAGTDRRSTGAHSRSDRPDPCCMTDTIRSGDVYLPTATTGLVVSSPDAVDEGFVSCPPVAKREVHRVVLPALQARDPRGRECSASSPIASSASDFSSPSAPSNSSMDMRHGTAQVSPTASRVSVRTSFEEADPVLERSSVFIGPLVVPAGEEVVQNGQGMAGVDVDRGRTRRGGREAPRRGASAGGRECRACSSRAPGPDRR